jgi:hypothetical protein
LEPKKQERGVAPQWIVTMIVAMIVSVMIVAMLVIVHWLCDLQREL